MIYMANNEDVVETPVLTSEQIERHCRVVEGKVVCPPQKGLEPGDIKEGMTKIKLGDQKIKSVRCIQNRKTDELECTVMSKGRQ